MAPGNRNQPKRAASSESRYSLMEFQRDFPDDATCLEWLWRTRFSEDGTHAECPKCQRVRAFKRYDTTQQRQSWTCTGCGYHVHPTAGTIFHKSSTALHLWFYAMYLMTSTRCGISAKQLERELGVTYKTAWRMFHLIRNELMTQDDDGLTGDVEVDESFFGGKPRLADQRQWQNLPPTEQRRLAMKRRAAKRTAVFGAVERGGKVRATVVPDRKRRTLHGAIHEFVLPEAVIFSDDWPAYEGIDRHYEGHRRINHSAKVYVEGPVHTQTIEGFWSLVKRGIGGTHHAVSAKYLQGYLNEYAWRYNHRKDEQAQFTSLLLRAATVNV